MPPRGDGQRQGWSGLRAAFFAAGWRPGLLGSRGSLLGYGLLGSRRFLATAFLRQPASWRQPSWQPLGDDLLGYRFLGDGLWRRPWLRASAATFLATAFLATAFLATFLAAGFLAATFLTAGFWRQPSSPPAFGGDLLHCNLLGGSFAGAASSLLPSWRRASSPLSLRLSWLLPWSCSLGSGVPELKPVPRPANKADRARAIHRRMPPL